MIKRTAMISYEYAKYYFINIRDNYESILTWYAILVLMIIQIVLLSEVLGESLSEQSTEVLDNTYTVMGLLAMAFVVLANTLGYIVVTEICYHLGICDRVIDV